MTSFIRLVFVTIKLIYAAKNLFLNHGRYFCHYCRIAFPAACFRVGSDGRWLGSADVGEWPSRASSYLLVLAKL